MVGLLLSRNEEIRQSSEMTTLGEEEDSGLMVWAAIAVPASCFESVYSQCVTG